MPCHLGGNPIGVGWVYLVVGVNSQHLIWEGRMCLQYAMWHQNLRSMLNLQAAVKSLE